MIRQAKNYFSFFGMMAYSADMKTSALYSMVCELTSIIIPQVEKIAQQIVIQPMKTKTINTK